jgi:hypothetical protein
MKSDLKPPRFWDKISGPDLRESQLELKGSEWTLIDGRKRARGESRLRQFVVICVYILRKPAEGF